ncbi:pyridoxal 5'-phosphate synthase glutaminase subunit PdxT [Anaerosinus massiliensis]|uniref:pyridoxal 5'-phosphate synthase glutaminase subunit PdxT n=1 Tax=Massilibacillus massiliensis TaxID=1806837 RepID=UPI000B1D7899|nr:pyridoxal 5'-phosphate synthase glutaminase subunit PdxT [Massilibacillus massiliensis]
MITIGVLAIQGAITEHITALHKTENVNGIAVKTLEEIEQVDGLILPGGESTAMAKILTYFHLLEPLAAKIQTGFPVWGTCAGMILLAKKIIDQETNYFNAMDIVVKRNAYGGQLDSFQTELSLPAIAGHPLPLVFIRAPYIESAADTVTILAEVDHKIVAAEQHNMLVTAFHPELTGDLSFHRYFCNKVQSNL